MELIRLTGLLFFERNLFERMCSFERVYDGSFYVWGHMALYRVWTLRVFSLHATYLGKNKSLPDKERVFI